MERWTGTPEGTWNVLRMFQETHAISARSSSTSRMWEKAFIGDDGPQVSRKGLFAVVRTNLERLEPMPFRTQLQTGYEGERSEMERWTRTPEGTWNVLRTFEETHAISARSSSTWLDRKTEDKKNLTVWGFSALLNSKSFALRTIFRKVY